MIRQESKRAPVAGPTAIRRCGIALGSNLGDRLANLQLAAKAVKMLADFSQPVFQAPVFETDPVGCAPGTPAFLNSVMEIGFFGEPEELLARLRAVESAMGRPSTREKASRGPSISTSSTPTAWCGPIPRLNCRIPGSRSGVLSSNRSRPSVPGSFCPVRM